LNIVKKGERYMLDSMIEKTEVVGPSESYYFWCGVGYGFAGAIGLTFIACMGCYFFLV